MKTLITVLLLTSLISINAKAQQLVINDSFTDGARDNGVDAYDANWWTTTTSSAIEINKGSLGLVTGTSGRGIRTTFAPQELVAGKTIKASFTFTTPETIGSDKESSLRFGMYDKLDRLGLEGDLSASSTRPNSLFDGLPGYMIDFDINLEDSSETNIGIRRHLKGKTGRLLSTTKAYKHLGDGGIPYDFAANQSYTGIMTLKKISTGVEVTGAISQNGAILSQYTVLDKEADLNNIGMLAFHVNSKTFGSSNKKDTPDNGLDLTNVKVDVSVARRGYR